ncbi:MAG: methionyl-tRNA formyltransferase [Cellvibrionaceae bacterium]|nr:methionyl-tRNA formyltransferase [Cellvibrionaceae bacterium]|tara:strand:+ start:2691 stop:3515 length:825 start_codon:yes stop_codon:yes gene_type:complete
MNVVYFGYNLFSSCLPVLEAHGHNIVCIYTGEDGIDTDQITSFATKKAIPLHVNRPIADHMEDLVAKGVELFFSAEYPWRIPIPKRLTYGINLHPTLLPHGRGPTPLIWLLTKYAEYSGITLHKMTDKMDEGDILLQQSIGLGQHETFNTLAAKLYLEAPRLLDRFLAKLDEYYGASVPQGEGSYWPKVTQQAQTLDWNRPIAETLRKTQRFGRLGVYAEIMGKRMLITAAEGSVYEHPPEPGTIALVDNKQLVIAVADGIIIIPRESLSIIIA